MMPETPVFDLTKTVRSRVEEFLGTKLDCDIKLASRSDESKLIIGRNEMELLDMLLIEIKPTEVATIIFSMYQKDIPIIYHSARLKADDIAERSVTVGIRRCLIKEDFRMNIDCHTEGGRCIQSIEIDKSEGMYRYTSVKHFYDEQDKIIRCELSEDPPTDVVKLVQLLKRIEETQK